MEHDVAVIGVWMQQGEADVGPFCRTCNTDVLPEDWPDGCDDEGGIPFSVIARAVSNHRRRFAGSTR